MLTLALGIGVSTTVFGIDNGVLVRSLPYPDASRLVLAWEGDRDDPDDTYIVAAPVYEDWRARNRTMSSLGIWEFITVNITGAADPEQVAAIRASASLFDAIAVRPALGRTFTADEDRDNAKVAIISDAIWRAHFDASPDALGRSMRLNDTTYEVIGVMPSSFAFPQRATGVYVPMAFTSQDMARADHSFYVIGRIRDGVTFEQAASDFDRIGRELASEYQANADEATRLTRLETFGMATVTRMLVALSGAAGLVLLIACVNVANLQIARALDRRREFAVQRALGAGVGRLGRQLFVEGLCLAGCGAAGGVFLAWLGTRWLDLLLGPTFLTFWFRGRVTVGLDGPALAFAVGAAGLTALLFSFAPLVGLRRTALTGALEDAGRGSTRTAFGVRRVLVAAEIALALVVLCGAGLLIKSFSRLLQVDSGIHPDRVLTMQVSLPQEDTYGPAVRSTFCADVSQAAAGGPFEVVGAISHLPFSGANAGRGLSIDGRAPDPDNPVNASYRLICSGYFRALQIPFISGRDALDSDADPVVVINRTMAEHYWHDEDPVGQRLRIGRTDATPWMRIVGVTENVRHFGLDSEPVREIFVPYRQNAWPVMTVVAKVKGDPSPLAFDALRDLVQTTYPGIPVAAVRPMSAVVRGSMDWRASFMRLLIVFAVLGLVLSAGGIYGVLAYFVTQRSREMGIRVALGATRPSIVRLVLGQLLAPATVGVVVGLAASIWSGRLLTDVLFQTAPGDLTVTVTIVVLVAVVGLLAGWIPARRAATLPPTVALRAD